MYIYIYLMMIRYSDSSFTWFSHGTKKTPNWLGPSMAEPRKIMDMTDIAMENGPFIDDFPIKASIYKGFSMAMLNNQMANTTKSP